PPLHRLLGGICQLQALLVARIDRALHQEAIAHEGGERAPEIASHEHDRELPHLAGLHEGGDLEHLVEGAEAAGQRDERVGVLHQHHLAHVEMPERDPTIEVRIRLLLLGQLDVAADGAPARLAGAAIRRFHDPGPAAGHHREPGARQPRAELAAEIVVRMISLEAGGAEHGDARADEVQRAEAAHELAEDADRPPQLESARLRALKEADLLRRGGLLAPFGAVGRRRSGRRIGRTLVALARQAGYSGPRADWTATTETLSGCVSSRGR